MVDSQDEPGCQWAARSRSDASRLAPVGFTSERSFLPRLAACSNLAKWSECFTRSSCVGSARELLALAKRTKYQRVRFGMLYWSIGRAADSGLGADSRADEVELPQPTGDPAPTGTVQVHQPSLMNAGEGCPRATVGRPTFVLSRAERADRPSRNASPATPKQTSNSKNLHLPARHQTFQSDLTLTTPVARRTLRSTDRGNWSSPSNSPTSVEPWRSRSI